MRLKWFTLAFPISALAGFLIAGCPDDQTLIHPPPPGPDATVDSGNPPTDGSTDGNPDGSTSAVNVRIAQLVPGLPAVDVCVAQDTGTSQDAGADADAGDAGDAGSSTGPAFTGPILAGFYGLAGGIQPNQITAYKDLGLAASALQGPSFVRVVRVLPPDAGSTDPCGVANRLGNSDISTTFPAANPGDVLTIAAVAGAAGAQVALFRDHAAASAPSKADVRFINAAAGGSNLDFGYKVGPLPADFRPIVSNVAFPKAGTTTADGGTAPDGYVQIDPTVDAGTTTVEIRPTTGITPLVKDISNFAPTAGTLTTVFALPGTTTLGALLCHDHIGPVGDAGPSLLSDCAIQ